MEGLVVFVITPLFFPFLVPRLLHWNWQSVYIVATGMVCTTLGFLIASPAGWWFAMFCWMECIGDLNVNTKTTGGTA